MILEADLPLPTMEVEDGRLCEGPWGTLCYNETILLFRGKVEYFFQIILNIFEDQFSPTLSFKPLNKNGIYISKVSQVSFEHKKVTDSSNGGLHNFHLHHYSHFAYFL